MTEYLAAEAEIGPERAALEWAEPVANVRRNMACLIGGQGQQTGFFSTTSTAWLSLVSKMDLSGKRVLISPHEWYDYIGFLQQRDDLTVEILPPLDLHNPDLSLWAARMDEDVAAIFAPMVTSVTGQLYPVADIGAMARPENCKFIVDAAQSLGQMPVDVGAIGCDALVSTTRKWLRGPRQTAILWVNDSWPFTGKMLEANDQNLALRLGLGAAIDHLLETGIAETQRGILARSNKIRNWASGTGLPVIKAQTGSVAIPVDDNRLDILTDALTAHGLVAKIPDAGFLEPYSTKTGMARPVLRLAPHVYTTEQDLEQLFLALETGFRL